ncbi:MAG: ABC transporter ATP-binding protein/permease [Spirochaetaceae bacterium]|jgi:ATP-binding cassette subfamily B protein/ATP-binding cassette subfamily C protein|nr:ABC transporter ATP-binding protein/permease [Spirochaetaceae bacterium]
MFITEKAGGAVTMVRRLIGFLPRRHKLYLIVLFIFSLIYSAVETVGVTVMMPFVSVILNPALIESGVYKKVYDFLKFDSTQKFIFTFGIGIVVFYILRSAYTIFYTYLQTRFSIGFSRNLAYGMFKNYLGIPYKAFVQKNPNEIATNINEATGVSGLLNNFLSICTEVILFLTIYIFLVALDWKMTLILTALLCAAVFGILQIIKISKIYGAKRYEAQVRQNSAVYEALWNYKFVKLSNSEDRTCARFYDFSGKVAHANVVNATLGTMPKSILESVGFSLLIGAILFILWLYKSPEKVISMIVMYALALYRILPSLNRMLTSVNMMFAGSRSLDVVYDALHQDTEKENAAPLPFNESITVNNVSFAYATGKEVLSNVSIKINKGEKVAFTGESGGGKSTLIDIIIGIHKPVSGFLAIDGQTVTNENIRSWRSRIGYIPQDIFLFDGTVAENVAFGYEMNEDRLIKTLKMANIWAFLQEKNGISTRIGNNGVLLSGGQKQRIGIARALYRDPEVLVLDEATSALDNETESRIMDEIYQLSDKKTLIVIAHRLTTVERCDRRVIIENGGIKLK